MAAAPVPEPAPGYLGPGASADAVAAALFSEDRTRFRDQYRHAPSPDAQRELVEQWRPLATLQLDPTRFATVVRQVAERLTGRTVPDDEPLSTTRRRAGL